MPTLHPILTTAENLTYSPEQVAVLQAAEQNVVVTAGAGAGKTRTLVARYLALLAERRYPLRSVAAITFTRKAAREMRNRVRQQIRRYLQQPHLPPDEQQYWQQLYRTLDAARIGTIHSLCAEILRTHPAEGALDPHFELLNEGSLAILQSQAVEQALTWAADQPELTPLFQALGEYRLADVMGQLLSQRLEAAALFDTLPADPSAAWQTALQRHQTETLTALQNDPAWQQALGCLHTLRANDPGDRAEIQRQAALTALNQATAAAAPTEKIAALQALNNIDLRGGSAKKWPGGKETLAEIKAALRYLRDQWRGAASVLTLALNEQDARLADLLPLLARLFAYAHQNYEQAKQERDALDFDDLEARTLSLFNEQPAVKSYWRQTIRVLLVDEFQDTNRRQAELIAHLQADAGRLFVVGDAKQSIYRFRGADVTVFQQQQKNVARLYELQTSYRAHRQLIEALNSLLRPVLGEPSPATPPYVAPFKALDFFHDAPRLTLPGPPVELHLTLGSKSDGALTQAALAVGQRIEQLRQAAPDFKLDQVAILCRSSASFAAYENALETLGLPYLTVAGRGFYERPEIRDVLNGLQALADPTDDLALVGLLRSPVVGVSDGGLYHLSQARPPAANVSLWQTLRQEPLPLVDAADQAAATWAISLIERLRQQAGRIAVADLIKQFLDETHYRAALLKAGQQRAARNLSKLLADAHASGLVSVGEFLEYVAGLRDSGSREGEARAIAEGAVQIMSVHAAKGLEFPVVIIGDVSYGGGRGRSGLLLDPELGPLLPLEDADAAEKIRPACYELGRLRENDQDEAESRRLLYVAATRASEKLILNGTVSLTKKGQLSRLGEWLGLLAEPLGLAEATPVVNPEGAQAVPLELAAVTSTAATLYESAWQPQMSPPSATVEVDEVAPPNPALLAPLPQFTLPPEFRSGQVSFSSTLPPSFPPAGGEVLAPPPGRGRLGGGRFADTSNNLLAYPSPPLPERVWQVVPATRNSRPPRWVIGSLVHEALAAWRFPDATFEEWAAARARSYGLIDAAQIAQAAAGSQTLLHRFQHSRLFTMMDSATQRLHEVPFSLLNGQGELVNGKIDALFRSESGWVMVEFKSDNIADQADLERTFAQNDYLEQVKRYQSAAAQLLTERPMLHVCLLDYQGDIRLLNRADLAQLSAAREVDAYDG